MIVQFSKYHGTGNDFIIIDSRNRSTSYLTPGLIIQLCHRRFGIGADGLIILEEALHADFRMHYFNADGAEGTMCGNGGRCVTMFAARLGLIDHETTFEGIDGMHSATLLPDGDIRLKLKDVNGISTLEDGSLLDTGSPHFVTFVPLVDTLNVEELGREIRNQPRFGEKGVNVNFVANAEAGNTITVRTYERGVEAETFSCGTGVTAAAIASCFRFDPDIFSYTVETRGGRLQVSFRRMHPDIFTDVYLTGPATHVYDGSIELDL